MAALQNFRSAFNGFNREDVVRYIEYINNQHNAQVNQLATQLKTLEAELERYRAIPAHDPSVPEKLKAAEDKCAALEQELEELLEQQAQDEIASTREAELEAYRRAERAERAAQARAGQLYDQANSALANATVKVEEASGQVSRLAEKITEDLTALNAAVAGSRDILKDAAAELYSIRPAATEE